MYAVLQDTRSFLMIEFIHHILFLQLCNGWTCRVVRVLPHTKSANTACKKTLLKMER